MSGQRNSPHETHIALQTLLTAIAYVVLGKGGQILEVLPGNGSLMWPPAGLAFALTVIMGARAIPGIFIGATIVNLMVLSPDQPLESPAVILNALSISMGACLQPWVGRVVWRRFFASSGFVTSIRNTAGFVLLAPLVCIVNPSIGAASMSIFGQIGATPVSTIWQTWWFGDTIGVLVFAPLVAAIYGMARTRALVLVIVSLTGLTSTYMASQHLRDRAEQTWLEKADLESVRLSETLLLWLDLSYASLRSITVRFHGSDFVTDDAFLDTIDEMEAMGASFLPLTIGYASDFDDDTSTGWKIDYSTDQQGYIARGRQFDEASLLGDFMGASRTAPGKLYVAPLILNEDADHFLLAAKGIKSESQQGLLIALINVTELVRGLKEQPGTRGLDLRLAMASPGADGNIQKSFLVGSNIAPSGVVKTFETVILSGDNQFVFLWDVQREFDGGPQEDLADWVLVGGIGLTALVSLFLTFLLIQNELIALRVGERTGELEAKSALMEAIMGAMSQGITAYGPDLKLIAANRKFREIRGYPEDMVFEGQAFETLLRYDLANKEFGDGDPGAILEQKLSTALRFEPHKFERHRPNGTFIEVQGGPLPGGGFVSTYTDITERKIIEARINKQVQELDEARRASLNMMADAELARARAEELREEADAARRNLQAALDNMTDGIYMFDSAMNITLFNNRYRELVDFPPNTIELGGPLRRLIAAHAARGDYGAGGSDAVIEARVVALGRDEPSEIQMVIGDGEKHLELRKSPISGGGGVVIVSDVTKRNKTQQALSSLLNVMQESIDYASNIQRSVLPSHDVFKAVFSEYFVVWEPRDVVGGDMYWCDLWGNGMLIILGDCTGHGVPGAFMTLIADGALQRAKTETELGDLPSLVQRMHQNIQTSLGQHRKEGSSDDGIDLGVIYITPGLDELHFTGAHFSLFVQQGGVIEELKGGRRGLGYRGIPLPQTYDVEKVKITAGMTFVMTTDGLIDQVGGERRRAFGKRRFKELMDSLGDMPLAQWHDAIMQALVEYQGRESRRDDVSLLGFRV